ncbi:MAG: PDZ domain-containing protein [Planctomycetes bacterium]|nr:PDZ domain-containing protein [Planctomycetota bacterium]
MLRRVPTGVLQAACAVLLAAAYPAAGEDTPPNPDAGKAAPAAWNVARLEGLVAKMRNGSFAIRDRASMDLAEAPPSMLPSIRVAVNDERDPEVRERLAHAGRCIFTYRVLPNLAEWKIGRGFLGISWTISSDPPGILVQNPIDGTGADKAGVRANDIIIAIDDIPCEEGFSQDSAINIWKGMAPGDPMKLRIKRGDEEVELKATIGERPAEYASNDGDQEKADLLWAQFLNGSLLLPAKLLHAEGSPADASKNGAEAKPNGAVTKASKDIERRRTQARPVQTWPKEMEGN